MQKTVNAFIHKYNLQADEHTRYIDLISEIGELGKEILSSTNYGKKPYSQTTATTEELGDCIFSLFALCCEMNVDAEEALRRAIAKYEARYEQKGSIGSEE